MAPRVFVGMPTCVVVVESAAVVFFAVASITISSDLFSTALSTISSPIALSILAVVVPPEVLVISFRSALVVALSSFLTIGF